MLFVFDSHAIHNQFVFYCSLSFFSNSKSHSISPTNIDRWIAAQALVPGTDPATPQAQAAPSAGPSAGGETLAPCALAAVAQLLGAEASGAEGPAPAAPPEGASAGGELPAPGAAAADAALSGAEPAGAEFLGVEPSAAADAVVPWRSRRRRGALWRGARREAAERGQQSFLMS